MSSKNPQVVERRLTPTEEIYVASGHGSENEPELRVPHYGCFGETILAGYRRQATHIAGTWVETLSLSRRDLLCVFEKNPRCAKRLVSIVLQDFRKKERLLDLSRKLLIGWAKRGTDLWAALVMQQVRLASLGSKPLHFLPHEFDLSMSDTGACPYCAIHRFGTNGSACT